MVFLFGFQIIFVLEICLFHELISCVFLNRLPSYTCDGKYGTEIAFRYSGEMLHVVLICFDGRRRIHNWADYNAKVCWHLDTLHDYAYTCRDSATFSNQKTFCRMYLNCTWTLSSYRFLVDRRQYASAVFVLSLERWFLLSFAQVIVYHLKSASIPSTPSQVLIRRRFECCWPLHVKIKKKKLNKFSISITKWINWCKENVFIC